MTALTVLHVNTERGFRGGEIQNLHLAAGLAERGHRNILAVQKGSELGARARKLNLDVRESAMRGEFDPPAVSWLKKLIRDERPHVVHHHTSHAITLGTLALLLRRTPPAVATRRTSFPTNRNPFFRIKFTFRLAHVITVSGSIRDDLMAAGVPAEQVTVVHSGIDLGRYAKEGSVEAGGEFRRELSICPDALVVGCVGALAAQKGHRALLRVTARLAQEIPELQLVLIGEGELMGAIRDEARELGLGERVHLTGFRNDVPRATAAFDVSVLPSIAGEGSPAAVKEAMALSVPAVATDIGGVREILEDGRQGLIVPPGDEPGLEDALRRLLRDRDLRARMGAAGRERAREFSMGRMVERTETIYRQVCGLREPAAPSGEVAAVPPAAG